MSLPPGAHPPEHEQSATEGAYVEGLDDVLRPRLSQRARLLRGGLLVALVLAVAVGLVWRSSALGLLAPSAPLATPPLSLAPPFVRIMSNVSFATVSVNGRNLGSLPAIAELRPGQNTIALDAPPFRPHTCTITWPVGGADDLACVVRALVDPQVATAGGRQVLVGGELNIEMAGADLAPEQCARALDIIERALDATVLATTVPAGQYFADGGKSPEGAPSSRIAPTDLRARLTVRAQAFEGRPCTSLLSGGIAQPHYAMPPPERAWGANVPILEQMVFARPDGRVVGRTPTMEGQIGLILGVPRDGGGDWQLATLDPPLRGQVTGNLIGAGIQALTNVFSQTHPRDAWGLGASGGQGLEGCRLELDTIDNGVETKTEYLWRFGVLLAVDAAAHKQLPPLPLAPAAELADVPPGP
jgi:hypothetical protein